MTEQDRQFGDHFDVQIKR